MSTKCAVCNKTAYPLESIRAGDKTYHKSCFKCSVCRLQLNVSNYRYLQGQVYCKLHVPAAKATTVSDDFNTKHAMSVPHRTAEGLGTVQKGTGGKPTIAVFGNNGPAAERQYVQADSGYFAAAPEAVDQSCEGVATGSNYNEPAAYDQGAAAGGYDQGGYDQGAGGYDQGGYDQPQDGGYDQGGYDQGGYDQGGY